MAGKIIMAVLLIAFLIGLAEFIFAIGMMMSSKNTPERIETRRQDDIGQMEYLKEYLKEKQEKERKKRARKIRRKLRRKRIRERLHGRKRNHDKIKGDS